MIEWKQERWCLHPRCKVKFIPNKKKQRFCSNKCRVDAIRRLPKTCANPDCLKTYQPKTARQKCCSRTCGAIKKHKDRPGQLKEFLARGRAVSTANRIKRLQSLLDGCATKKEAFQLGVKFGRTRGWTIRNRARKQEQQGRL